MNRAVPIGCLITAYSTRSASAKNIGIFWRKFMTFRAVCFSGIASVQSIPSKEIFFACYGLKMIWIDAISNAAQMVQLEILRNWPSQIFENNSVYRFLCFAVKYPNFPISLLKTSGKQPTSRFNFHNFIHYPIKCGTRGNSWRISGSSRSEKFFSILFVIFSHVAALFFFCPCHNASLTFTGEHVK